VKLKPPTVRNAEELEPLYQIVHAQITTMKNLTENVNNVLTDVTPVTPTKITVKLVPKTESANQIVLVQSDITMMENLLNVSNVIINVPNVTSKDVPNVVETELTNQVVVAKMDSMMMENATVLNVPINVIPVKMKKLVSNVLETENKKPPHLAHVQKELMKTTKPPVQTVTILVPPVKLTESVTPVKT